FGSIRPFRAVAPRDFPDHLYSIERDFRRNPMSPASSGSDRDRIPLADIQCATWSARAAASGQKSRDALSWDKASQEVASPSWIFPSSSAQGDQKLLRDEHRNPHCPPRALSDGPRSL